ncbi:MAG: hypothetical protein HY822_24240 [Acidobacteria bacterium]|nr:hypothetical protein [Acidobacteriota bacterium]
MAGALPLPLPVAEGSELAEPCEPNLEPGGFEIAAMMPRPVGPEAGAPVPTDFMTSPIEPAPQAVASAVDVPTAPRISEPEPRISVPLDLRVVSEPARSLGPVLVQRQISLPTGLVHADAMEEAISSNVRLTGVVVAVVLGETEKGGSSKNRPQETGATVESLVRGLLGPDDLAFQQATGEFILIFPNENGSAAQRRIQRVSEKLWDLQLRSLVGHPITLHWGAAAVESENISEAISLAVEEMIETRDNRRGIGMESFRPRRRVANF